MAAWSVPKSESVRHQPPTRTNSVARCPVPEPRHSRRAWQLGMAAPRCSGIDDRPKHRARWVAGAGSRAAPVLREPVPQRRSECRLQCTGPEPQYAMNAAGIASGLSMLEEEVHAEPRAAHAPIAGRENPASASTLFDASEKSAAVRSIGNAVRHQVGGDHEGVWSASHESCRPIFIPSIGT